MHGKPSLSILSTPIMLSALEWDSLASQRNQNKRERSGALRQQLALPQLLHSSLGRDTAPRAPGFVSELTPRRALPLECHSSMHCPPPAQGTPFSYWVLYLCACNCTTTEPGASPAITLVLYSFRSNFQFVRRSYLQKYPSEPSSVHSRTEGARAEWPVHSSAYTYTV